MKLYSSHTNDIIIDDYHIGCRISSPQWTYIGPKQMQ